MSPFRNWEFAWYIDWEDVFFIGMVPFVFWTVAAGLCFAASLSDWNSPIWLIVLIGVFGLGPVAFLIGFGIFASLRWLYENPPLRRKRTFHA